MGALTVKSFPFELRGWDIEKFRSIDPTDGFGLNTKIYTSNQQVVQIEPDYEVNTSNTWLSDKGRQFFDGIFNLWDTEKKDNKKQKVHAEKESWYNILKVLFKTLYLFGHSTNKSKKNNFFIVVFENLSIEMLSLLTILKQNYTFLIVKRAENIKLNNDLESYFQLNATVNQTKLRSSTLCMLVSNNPKYEGYLLNLSLRQRFLKGNFKCVTIGTLTDSIFPIDFLGTKLKIVKTILEGNNLICQDLKSAKNPILILNTEIFKRHDGKNFLKIIEILKYSKIFNRTWNGLNILNSSLYETGTQSLVHFSFLTSKDLFQFSSLYLINLVIHNIPNFKKITETKLLNFNSSLKFNTQLKINKIILDQNTQIIKNNLNFYETKKNVLNNKNLIKYFYLPVKMFYENKETFFNTKGLIKRTSKLISRKKTKNSWKLLRRFLKSSKLNLTFINHKDNFLLFFNSKNKINFTNFVALNFQATQNLCDNAFIIQVSNNPFFIFLKSNNFKQKKFKFNNTKLKYWLNDFFIGGKDGYSQNSLILAKCSNLLRSQKTNFF